MKYEKKQYSGNWRIYVFIFLVCVAAFFVCVRLYSLQVSAYDLYKSLAADQHTLFKKLVPERGEIFLNDKTELYPLAVNRETKMAYAVPREIENTQDISRMLSSVLNVDQAEIFNKLNKPEDRYEVLKHRLSEQEIEQMQALKAKGVYLSDESYRYYPSGELASNILGFVGWKENEITGRYGLEEYFEENLKGKEGNILQDRDTLGRWISTGRREIIPARHGDDIVLTLDHIVQYETEKILKSAVEKHQADSGLIIVMEPETGNILSMANYPTFNPNEYSKVEDINAYRNLSVSAPYEPGSVFKPLTMAAALDSNKVTPESTYTDTGAVHEAGYTIQNSDEKVYGTQTMTQVLENSLNTGAIYAEKMVGNKNFADYVKRFGFGETTGIEMMGESAGNISNLKNTKSDINFFTASFGQGITVTPIQLISAYGALANGGMLMKPRIVDKVISYDGTEEQVSPAEVRRVISKRAAFEISEMLKSVVIKGHGKKAGVPGYAVGGKTGTAQVTSAGTRGYEEGKTIGSFVGFAPVHDPKFVILVKIENPKDVIWAESSAAPTFGELMKFLLEYYKIEPTEEYTEKDLEIFNQTHNLKEFFVKKEEENNSDSE